MKKKKLKDYKRTNGFKAQGFDKARMKHISTTIEVILRV